ncbi:hypothetical protein VTH06DRAFT_6454 [Thermothelomyces fergusii]
MPVYFGAFFVPFIRLCPHATGPSTPHCCCSFIQPVKDDCLYFSPSSSCGISLRCQLRYLSFPGLIPSLKGGGEGNLFNMFFFFSLLSPTSREAFPFP